MAIYICGDTHGEIDIKKLYRTGRTIMNKLTPKDYLIILGDFGGIWDGSIWDDELLDWYEKQPYTILFVDGNHENHFLLNRFPVEDWCGGKIHRIRQNVFHLMRAQIFTIEGKTFLTMGGACSIDKAYRTQGIDWWAGEVATDKERKELYDIVEATDKVDYILTHCAPTTILHRLSASYRQDEMTDLMDSIYYNIEFSHWYFGHYHMHMDFEDRFGNKFHARYNIVEELKE